MAKMLNAARAMKFHKILPRNYLVIKIPRHDESVLECLRSWCKLHLPMEKEGLP